MFSFKLTLSAKMKSAVIALKIDTMALKALKSVITRCEMEFRN